ncbi:MAG: hypothetical protein HS111_33105 [Kofleriaceae bacterium]|nr:hypothetical protein [Kofleriaceae bacterium]
MSMPVAMTPLRHVRAWAALRPLRRPHLQPDQGRRITSTAPILPGGGLHRHPRRLDVDQPGQRAQVRLGKADQAGLLNAIVGTPSPLAVARNLPRMARGDAQRPAPRRPRPAVPGDGARGHHRRALEPVIDGEFYKNVKRLSVHVGPRVRIPAVVGKRAAGVGPAAAPRLAASPR